MVTGVKYYKKCSPNGRVSLYMGRRDFVDSNNSVEPIVGVVVLSEDYVQNNRKVFIQLICNFRYGREQDEVMGLRFQRELILGSVQVHPQKKSDVMLTRTQEALLKNLGSNAFPFVLEMPPNSPASVILQQKAGDETQPCGVQYFVKAFSGEFEDDRSNKRSTVSLGIRKVQKTMEPSKQIIQPCSTARKEFLTSPGELELEVTLDKQLYYHGEKIAISICVKNNSAKVVNSIKAMVQQGIDVALFKKGQLRQTIASSESTEGCPIQPGCSIQKTIYLVPTLISNINKAGIAIEGHPKKRETTYLASSTMLSSPINRDAFGIVVSYSVKVKATLAGAMGGEAVAEVPFALTLPESAECVKLLPEDFENENIVDV